MDLAKIVLGHFPTPLEAAERLTAALDPLYGSSPRLWIKRDDCTGLATGGNKTRKLEFLLGDAARLGADVLITAGAVQSNHVRQTVAAAAKCNLPCHVVLEQTLNEPDYLNNGNALLDRLMGATVHLEPREADLEAAMGCLAESLQEAGHRPYVIPIGGSNAIGANGYATCAEELLDQCRASGFEPDYVVHATGSAGTQAGLLAGLTRARVDTKVVGICVSRDAKAQQRKVYPLYLDTLKLLGCGAPAPSADAVLTNSDYVGPGYGLPAPSTVTAIERAARLEGLVLDPVYSGKAMDGLLDLGRQGKFANAKHVVFLHTGGSAALFAYKGLFTP